MVNRGRDAKDILTATVGGGAGGKVRAGPLQLGLMLNCAEMGLRGGEFVRAAPFQKAESGLPGSMDALYWAYGIETFNGGPLAPARGKSFHAVTFAMCTAPISERFLFGKKSRRHSGEHAKYSPIPYWTQIEAAIGVGGTIRLGVNPGELIDFLLGWTTLDIFGDDIEERAKRQPPGQQEAASALTGDPTVVTEMP